MANKRYLVLENGRIFSGTAFGADVETLGEVVFTTAMTGYIETLTDPSYFGQIVVQTFPQIGNYGMIAADIEAPKPSLSGYIVREWCENPSNFRCEGDLDTYLRECGIPGLAGIDTRELTKILREHGVMNAKMVHSLEDAEKAVKEATGYQVKNAVLSVSSGEKTTLKSDTGRYHVALWDFGAKGNIAKELIARGCKITLMPAAAKAEDILALHPDGIMLSNGPGDPAENVGIIAELREVCKAKIPTFGICLGHQLLALSQGAKTGKLKYGHRGANQPVKNVETGRIYISSQNHGYAVLSETLPKTAKESFFNVNDKTCEGVRYLDMPVFSVQFHPEACGGPLDTRFLFDEFIALMEEKKNA